MIPWDIAHMPAPEDFEILCARMQLRSSEDGRFTVGSSHGCVEYGVASDWEPGVELEGGEDVARVDPRPRGGRRWVRIAESHQPWAASADVRVNAVAASAAAWNARFT
jgi:hypothetical protein